MKTKQGPLVFKKKTIKRFNLRSHVRAGWDVYQRATLVPSPTNGPTNAPTNVVNYDYTEGT